jgi:hypothetical protein
MNSHARATLIPASLKYKISIAFLALLSLSLGLVILSLILQGNVSEVLSNPVRWFNSLNASTATGNVNTVSQLLAAILSISITVVAIVVELAANRYSHRITALFVREPVNIIVMGFFVVATIFSIWTAVILNTTTTHNNISMVINLLMATAAFALLLPYFAFVMTFLSPVTVINKIRNNALYAVQNLDKRGIEKSQAKFLYAIDDLQDIARRSAELSDRAVEMASVSAMLDIILIYQEMLEEIENTDKGWFNIGETIKQDPDFVSINKISLTRISAQRTWVEVKIMRQYLDLVSDSSISSRDTSYLIAINTRRIATASVRYREDPELIELCLRCFNSYLRATINNKDARTGYYIMDQYRMLAEDLLKKFNSAIVREIAHHLQFYGLLGFTQGMTFLIEVAAEDIAQLAMSTIGHNEKLLDELLELLLELDQEIQTQCQEENLLGVRRAQIKLAAHFLTNGDIERASRICEDIKAETQERKQQLIQLLEKEKRMEYWEFTDRGVNFAYIPPEEKAHLPRLAEMIQ